MSEVEPEKRRILVLVHVMMFTLLLVGSPPCFADHSRATVEVIEYASNLSSHPAELTVAAGTLFFSADDGLHGRELWCVDPEGKVRLSEDILPGPEGS